MTPEEMEAIIERHVRSSPYRGDSDAAACVGEVSNPQCGDLVKISLVMEDDVVQYARFSGMGCALSQASGSMACQLVEGLEPSRIERLGTLVGSMARGELDMEREEFVTQLGEAVALAGVAKFPLRVRCVLLAWEALTLALARRVGG